MLTALDIRRVGVVGSGVMGVGIAQVCAVAGLDVRVAVSCRASLAAGRKRLLSSLDYCRRKEFVTQAQREEALDRIGFTVDLGELADRHLLVEAVTEHVDVKLNVFAALDKIVEEPHAILASTTSAIPIIRLARATSRGGQVIGLHFFSPVPVMGLVEVAGSLLTEPHTRAVAEAFVTQVLGKQTIPAPDRAGFVVTALIIPHVLSAIRMVDSGLATADVVDKGMTLGVGHPVGPLRLADLLGLDLVLAVSTVLYEEFRQTEYAPPPLLLRMVQAGHLGKKSGCGFHQYTDGGGR